MLNQSIGIALFFLLPKSVKRKKDEFAETRQLTCATAASECDVSDPDREKIGTVKKAL